MKAYTSPIVAMISAAFVSYAEQTSAQELAAPLPPEVLACASEIDVMLRLSCYDREVAAYRNLPAAPPSAVPSTPEITVAPNVPTKPPSAPTVAVGVVESVPTAPAAMGSRSANSVDNFGFDAPTDEITSNVTRIRERPYGELIVYLENGQVWEQKHLDRRFRLKTGESVTISKSAVAGYRLSGNSNRSIQVERLK